MTTLSQTLAEHIAGANFAQLSPKAVHMTRYSLLDALGVMLGASGIGEGCDAFVQLALDGHAKPEATILGYRQQTSASLAAFANGAMAHALDFEDAHDAAPVHPNAQTIPAALALAEALPSVTGGDLLTAIAVGCDLVSRLGMCLTVSLDQRGWYPPPILGAFGATAAAARLLNLNDRQILDAFSLTLGQIGCSAELKYNPQTVIRSVRDAFAAQTGVVSAQLAKNGVRGFDQPFEGKAGFFNNFAGGGFDAAILLNDIGRRYEGENVSFKPWPACRGTHAFIDAAFQLQQEFGVEASHIVSGRMIGHRVQTMLYEPLAQKRAPSTAIDAKFSLPFTVATALLNRAVTLESYSAAALVNPAILELARKLTFEVSSDAGATDNATRGTLELRLRDGQTLSRHVEHPLGHTTRPISEADLISKFTRCAQYSRRPTSVTDCDRISSAVLTLDSVVDLRGGFFSLLR